jgi:hypothetical protein
MRVVAGSLRLAVKVGEEEGAGSVLLVAAL